VSTTGAFIVGSSTFGSSFGVSVGCTKVGRTTGLAVGVGVVFGALDAAGGGGGGGGAAPCDRKARIGFAESTLCVAAAPMNTMNAMISRWRPIDPR
jgi:hypothetical protein